MMMHGATNPRAKRRHPPPRNQTKTPAQLQEGDVTNLYGCVGIGCGIECCVAHKTTDKGDNNNNNNNNNNRLVEGSTHGSTNTAAAAR